MKTDSKHPSLPFRVVAVVVALAWSCGLTGTATAARPVEDSYIVQTRSSDVETVRGEAMRGGGRIRHVYRQALNGFAATMPPAAAQALERNPRVQSIVPDVRTTLAASNPQLLGGWTASTSVPSGVTASTATRTPAREPRCSFLTPASA